MIGFYLRHVWDVSWGPLTSKVILASDIIWLSKNVYVANGGGKCGWHST